MNRSGHAYHADDTCLELHPGKCAGLYRLFHLRRQLGKPEQVFRLESSGLFAVAVQCEGGVADQHFRFGRRLDDEQVAQVFQDAEDNLFEIVALTEDPVDQIQSRGHVLLRHDVQQLEIDVLVHDAQDFRGLAGGQRGAAEGHDLVQQAFGVPHAAVHPARDEGEGLALDVVPALLADHGQVIHDGGTRYAPEVEALAPGEHGGDHFPGVRRREDEVHVGRRLFERLQQGVEGLLGQHVHFVDDVDLVLALAGGVLDALEQMRPDLFDPVVGRAVDLQDVDAASFRDFPAERAGVAGRHRRAFDAVQGLGQDAGRGRLAHAAGSGEEVGMGDLARLNGVFQRGGDVFLPDHAVEFLGAPFSGGDFVGQCPTLHAWVTRDERQAERRGKDKAVVHPPSNLLASRHPCRRLRPGAPAAHASGAYRCYLPVLTGLGVVTLRGT